MLKRKGSPRKERTSDIGKYLTNIREEQDKTQQEIAASIRMSRSCICKIERGVRTEKSLHGSILYQLAEAYGVSITEILKAANWTQLPLLDTTEEERQELIRYLNEIRGRKNKER